MRRTESLSSYRRFGESLAQTRERLRSVVADADRQAFAKWIRSSPENRALFAKATSLFGSNAAAIHWMTRPMIELGGYCARDLVAASGGEKMVSEVLDRLLNGLYS